MRTSKMAIMAMAAGLSLLGSSTWNITAAEKFMPYRTGRGQTLESIKERLDLTDNQVSQIRAEFGAERDTLKSLIARLHEARVDLRQAIRAANASEASVRAASAIVGAVQADLAVERFKLYGRINPILTEEQREKVKDFEAQIDDWVETALQRLGERRQTR